MIKIKLKRKLWFYPHRCPDCGKVLVFTKHYDQVRCRKCGKKQQRRNKAARLGVSLNKMKKQRWTHHGQSRYNSIRKECLEIGNCFKTEEEAKRAAEYLKALAVVRGDGTSKFIKGIDNWSVHYYAPHNCLDVSDNSYCIRNGIFGLPYFATREDAQRSIDLHKNEWLTIFGVKEEECD